MAKKKNKFSWSLTALPAGVCGFTICCSGLRIQTDRRQQLHRPKINTIFPFWKWFKYLTYCTKSRSSKFLLNATGLWGRKCFNILWCLSGLSQAKFKIRCRNECWRISATLTVLLLWKWPGRLQGGTCCHPLQSHYKAICPFVLCCANGSCMIFAVMSAAEAGTGLTVALWGSMVSVKTDFDFVVLALGGGEDLFSDVTAGLLVLMFICLSQWRLLSHWSHWSWIWKESPAAFRHWW